MKGSEIKKLLKEHGCFLLVQGGNHEIWFSPKTGHRFQVPRHNAKEVPTGTQRSIFKSAGIIKRGN